MGAVRYYNETIALDIAKILAVLGVLKVLVGIPNLLMNRYLLDISFIQLAIIDFLGAGFIYAGYWVIKNDYPHFLGMGLYGVAFTALFDFIYHVVLLTDINGVQTTGPTFLFSEINLLFFQVEPWWYWYLDTGLIGGIVLMFAGLIMWPKFAPYRFIIWPLIGGFITSTYYGAITNVFSTVTGGLVAARGTWSWTTLWLNLGIIPGTATRFSLAQDIAAVVFGFTWLHYAAIWAAGVLSHRLIKGREGYVTN